MVSSKVEKALSIIKREAAQVRRYDPATDHCIHYNCLRHGKQCAVRFAPIERVIATDQVISKYIQESVFARNEDQPLRLRFLQASNLPISVALVLFEAGCLKIVKDVPVGE